MTKQEAEKLERRCDKIMSGYLGEECTVCMALSGRLKIIFNDGDYVTFSMTSCLFDWLNYNGFYSNLERRLAKIEECIEDNRDIFEQLLWSYENRTELEE